CRPAKSDRACMQSRDPTPTSVPSTSLHLREQGPCGEAIALDAEPAAVRVRLAVGASELAVTITPAEADPAAATLPGAARAVLLRDLEAAPDAPPLALLLYLALQRARVWRRGAVVSAD